MLFHFITYITLRDKMSKSQCLLVKYKKKISATITESASNISQANDILFCTVMSYNYTFLFSTKVHL